MMSVRRIRWANNAVDLNLFGICKCVIGQIMQMMTYLLHTVSVQPVYVHVSEILLDYAQA